ncbi:MAG: nicotinamide-nucleotide amidohydrolase family protein [Planctomycetota bacterium]|nr:nicotinamide-nucleotide amidohydrolase family protein [Planctomycetota bacterium]
MKPQTAVRKAHSTTRSRAPAASRAKRPGAGDGRALARRVYAVLEVKRISLAIAESCSGGLVCDLLTDVPGISRRFLEGIVCYGNGSKTDRLGVPVKLIERHGAVSGEVASAMAAGVARTAGADAGLGATGVAGPSGGSPGKPVGLVFIAAYLRGVTRVRRYLFHGSRRRIKISAARAALQMLLARIAREP